MADIVVTGGRATVNLRPVMGRQGPAGAEGDRGPTGPGADVTGAEIEAARNTAVQAATDAEAHKTAVEAVVATNDGIMTAVAEDENSAFHATQMAAIGGEVAPVQAAAVNALESRAVADLFRGRIATDAVGITYVSADRWRLHRTEAACKWMVDLFRVPGLPGGGQLVHQLQSSNIDVTRWSPGGVPSYTYVDQEDAAVVHTNTTGFFQWTAQTPQAAAYGGGYRFTNVAGDDVTWTTPAGTTYINFRTMVSTVIGYALVEINADKTLANALPTAQDEVTAGRLPSTALVANGGTLNPTDRVWEGYSTTTNYDYTAQLATGLTAGAHAVKLTCTGYKRAAASDARIVSSGFGSSATPVPGPFDTTYEVTPNAYSAWEYALDLGPTETGSHEYIGNVHGFETQNSIKVYVDGVEDTSKSAPLTGDDVTILRETTVADSTYFTGTVFTARTMYRMAGDGLEVINELTFAQDAWAFGGYLSMFPVDEDMARGVIVGRPGEIDLTPDGGGAGGAAREHSQAAYVYDPATGVSALMYLPDLTGVDGWQHSPTVDGGMFIEDRAGNLMNKIYAARYSVSGKTLIPSGTVLRSRTVYRATAFPDASLAIGQA